MIDALALTARCALAAAARSTRPSVLLLWAGLLAWGADADRLAEIGELLERGAVDQAVLQLRSYVDAHPDDSDGRRLLGISLALIPQRSRALAELRRSVELGPDNPANHLALGQALARFGEQIEARKALRRSVELSPSLAPAHEGLALSLALDGDLDEALTHFSFAIEHTPDPPSRARLHYLRGKAYAQAERVDAAADDFEKAVALNPTLAPAYLEWGRILTESADQEAVAVLSKASELMPQNYDAQYLLGTQLLNDGDAQRALAPLRRAVELRPADRSASYSLGRALRAAGRRDEARDRLAALASESAGRAVSESEINEAGRLNNLGLQQEAQGDYAAALSSYEAAVEIAPEDLRFRRNAALALCRLDRWEEAKVRLREILRMAPGDVDATKALYVALEHAPDQR